MRKCSPISKTTPTSSATIRKNLLATSLAMNAYMLEHEPKYKKWLLEYVDAWLKRMQDNGGIIPTNIGLDGKIGSAAGGKWYGGVYGWAFSVIVPQTKKLAHRNTHAKGFVGFMNAYLLTHGDDRYLDAWRIQMDKINAQAKTIDGRKKYPRMFGDEGWYHFVDEPYSENALEIYYLSMNPSDRKRVPDNAWLRYLSGTNPNYPIASMQADFAQIRKQMERVRQDETTPDTRLADDPMVLNPCNVRSLIHLMLGGIHPRKKRLDSPLPAALFRSAKAPGRHSRRRGRPGGKNGCRSRNRDDREPQPDSTANSNTPGWRLWRAPVS
ncbi:MAG: hypothetical protein KatS3mg105_0089 [Gemmatales bacterium]|nr:MAG: hypothetical protein KatS3mg105_0089 [Gemmatales bacterium]